MSSNDYRKCAKCGKTRAEDMAVTFHRFPMPGKKNSSKAQAWAKYCWPCKDWTSVESLKSLYDSNKVLCGRHFSSSLFYDSERKKLSIFAVPDIHESPKTKEIDKESSITQLQQKATTSSIQIIQIENLDQNILAILPSAADASPPPITPIAIEQNAEEATLQSCPSSCKRKGLLPSLNISSRNKMTPRELKLYRICQKN